MKTISFKTIFLNIFVIFAIIFTFSMPFLSTQNVFAEEQIKRYYYIVQNTYLIPEGQEIKGNIQLNASYYVQATGNPSVVINDIAYNYVIYNGITGKVPIASLSKKTIDNVYTPYFISSSKLTVNSDSEIWMFYNIDDESTRCLRLANNSKLDFIAYSEKGDYILAKYTNGTVGFVKKNLCTPTIIYSPHPNPINPDTTNSTPNFTPDGNTQDTKKMDKAAITRIILIVTLCVVAVVVIFLLFKPSGNKRKVSKDDFYDY